MGRGAIAGGAAGSICDVDGETGAAMDNGEPQASQKRADGSSATTAQFGQGIPSGPPQSGQKRAPSRTSRAQAGQFTLAARRAPEP